ncbi:unnamed protein product [Oreochromis niloticus]|nr:unnamed protein product [Mustela putorius furo]
MEPDGATCPDVRPKRHTRRPSRFEDFDVNYTGHPFRGMLQWDTPPPHTGSGRVQPQYSHTPPLYSDRDGTYYNTPPPLGRSEQDVDLNRSLSPEFAPSNWPGSSIHPFHTEFKALQAEREKPLQSQQVLQEGLRELKEAKSDLRELIEVAHPLRKDMAQLTASQYSTSQPPKRGSGEVYTTPETMPQEEDEEVWPDPPPWPEPVEELHTGFSQMKVDEQFSDDGVQYHPLPHTAYFAGEPSLPSQRCTPYQDPVVKDGNTFYAPSQHSVPPPCWAPSKTGLLPTKPVPASPPSPVTGVTSGHCNNPSAPLSAELVYRGPNPTIPRFIHPDPSEFARLRMALENLLPPPNATELFKYQILVDHLKLDEARLIADAYLNSSKPYTDTMAALHDKFGQPHQLALRKIASVLDGPEIRRGDTVAFQRFSLQSLNQFLLPGPTLGASLLGVVVRFREHPIAVSGDIKGMFHQVLLLPEDRPLLKFLWWDLKVNEPPKIFKWQVLPFGTISSPCCATFALQRHVMEHTQPDDSLRFSIERCFYVDNCLQSVGSPEEARDLVDRLRELLKSAGFELRQWACNDPSVLSHLPPEARSQSLDLWLAEDKSNPLETTLGLSWDWNTDSLGYKHRPVSYEMPTLRNIYRVLASQYDPLGYLLPFTTRAKLLLRQLWDKKHVLIHGQRTQAPSPVMTSLSSGRAQVRHYKQAILRQTQQESFPEECTLLSERKPVSSRSRLLTLAPELDTSAGLIRVGGRLRRLEGLDGPILHPIVLDPSHPFTRLLIQKYDVDLHHPGPEWVFAEVRRSYWILRGREAVRKHQRTCPECQRWRAQPSVPKMADLPAARLRLYKPAFYSTGVDCFGPMFVKVGRRHEKRWGIIFKCMTTRAVHLDLLSSLDADAFLMALRQFIARRGTPAELWSDCGTNFKGGERELREAFANMSETLQGRLARQKIRFQFTPPAAPHFGGVWEREIRSVKSALRTCVGSQPLHEEVLLTVLLKVELILNVKPLGYVSTNVANVDPVTPNSLLMGQPDGSLPQVVYPETENLCR